MRLTRAFRRWWWRHTKPLKPPYWPDFADGEVHWGFDVDVPEALRIFNGDFAARTWHPEGLWLMNVTSYRLLYESPAWDEIALTP